MVCTMTLECRSFECLLLIVRCMRNFGGRSIFCFLACMSIIVRAPYCLSMVSDKCRGPLRCYYLWAPLISPYFHFRPHLGPHVNFLPNFSVISVHIFGLIFIPCYVNCIFRFDCGVILRFVMAILWWMHVRIFVHSCIFVLVHSCIVVYCHSYGLLCRLLVRGRV